MSQASIHLGLPRHSRTRRALAIHEVLVGSIVLAVLVAAVLPAAARLRHLEGDAVTFANLQVLAAAHAAYAADWDDRQVTWIPDDAGVVGGNCTQYIFQLGCPSQFILGDDINGDQWGYYLGCGGFGGSCGNWVVYKPVTFTPNNIFGSFRIPNAQAFSPYVDGKFYSTSFYTPEDFVTWVQAKPTFSIDAEFAVLPGLTNIVFSSYALSPAAMLDPAALSYNKTTGKYWKNPNSFATGYASPTVSMAAYPELKTRMIEHNWCDDPPSETNPNFAGSGTPWFFNLGIAATPVTLFFDGSVAELPNAEVVADDEKLLDATGVGLWSRDTPLGANGYYGAQSYDSTLVSHHILTIDGILGRDRLGAGR